MPRVQITLRDLDEIDELEEQEDWEQRLGLRAGEDPRSARSGSSEVQAARRNVRGTAETLLRKRSERRKNAQRGGRRSGP